MPLFINGVILDDSPPETCGLFQVYSSCKESSVAFCSQPPKIIGSVGLLYVNQREYAVTVPHDKNVTVLGTDDATTCHMAILRHPGSGVTSLAHFDSSGIAEGVMNMIRRIQELSVGYPACRLELHLVGGFQDSRGYSEELSISLLQNFHKQPVGIDLLTGCIGELNDTFRDGIHWPIVYGVGVDVKTGEVFPAIFTDKGPDLPLRSARNLTGPQQVQFMGSQRDPQKFTYQSMLDIYDCTLGLLRIGPFNYEPLRGVGLWLQQGDEFILQHLSTSPEVEPPNFVQGMRATLKYIQEHPFPAVTLFPDNRSRFYRKDEGGAWVPLHY